MLAQLRKALDILAIAGDGGLFKWYYLLQLSFTAQLLLAIQMEARRKDYLEMLTHHIITLSLISITYTYRYT